MRSIRWKILAFAVFLSLPEMFFAEDLSETISYKNIRGRLLKEPPAGMAEEVKKNPSRIYGILMEIGFEKGSVTLLSYLTGQAGLYFSGGGMVEGEINASVKMAAEKFVKSSPLFISAFQPVKKFPLPKEGEVRFYFLTGMEVLGCSSSQDVLRGGRDFLSPLFLSGNDVITELRKVSEGNNSDGKKVP